MLTLTGNGQTTTCDGRTRRDFMQIGALGAVGLTLPQYLAAKEQGGHAAMTAPHHDLQPGGSQSARHFDMKPNAPAEVRGPFKAINTSADGILLSEILPMHAKIADKIGFVRSVHHTGAAVHDAGWQMLQTGRQFQGGVNTPHAGAVLAYLKGRKTDLPPFVVLPELMGRGGGNLPMVRPGDSSARPTIHLP